MSAIQSSFKWLSVTKFVMHENLERRIKHVLSLPPLLMKRLSNTGLVFGMVSFPALIYNFTPLSFTSDSIQLVLPLPFYFHLPY